MLTEIPQELLILIVEHTDVFTALALRSTCRVLQAATRDKQLWIALLQKLVQAGHVPLSRSLENLEHLTPEKVEAITCRAASLCNAWENHTIRAKTVWRADLTRSVTWLRLVESRFLLIASSDTVCSSLELYDLASLETSGLVPLTECYVPGPILSGEAEIQDGRLYVAVALDTRVPKLQVLTLCDVDDLQSFGEIQTLTGYGDIMLLHRDVIVCGTKDNVAIPHIVDWKTGLNHAVEKVPDYRGTRFKAYIWDNLLVTIGTVDVKLYSLPSLQSPPCVVHTFPLATEMCGDVEEVSFFKSSQPINITFPFTGWVSTSTELSWIKSFSSPEDYPGDCEQGSVWRCSLLRSLDPNASELYSISDPERLTSPSGATSVTSGTIGGQALWVDQPYHFGLSLYSALRTPPTESVVVQPPHDLPSLAAFPQLAFDDASGIIAVGNLAGEVAIVDLVGAPFTSLSAGDPLPLTPVGDIDKLTPTTIIPLDVITSLLNRPTDMNSLDYEQHLLADRIRNLDSSEIQTLPELWRDRKRLRIRSHECENIPFLGDLAFELSHSFEFLGRVQLIISDNMSHTLLSKGGLYFVYTGAWGEEFIVFRGGTTLEDILNCIFTFPEAGLKFPGLDYKPVVLRSFSSFAKEQSMKVATRNERRDLGKNRFHEMRARGGSPSTWLTNGMWLALGSEQPMYEGALPRWETLYHAVPEFTTQRLGTSTRNDDTHA
ncbi:hypothetical protein CONPUDRAFT_146189 [Coniophora puteana RWD-64-598 SS2]|uniref:F-box domain-containing protein n=1 Tax=Coniophora puteana (strain RWD-64-598) TaxID=741705 RepID=A0A5M3MES2_CONPW|nr:uncharacterized protein CONPUDRAFT_146189 [Coniophora puteana RWD-64-598 SS2]EIW77105.1 hypothetical protein CONPUDRAFT_146189 [Coniophora puteana RWD-64-598 SS2]